MKKILVLLGLLVFNTVTSFAFTRCTSDGSDVRNCGGYQVISCTRANGASGGCDTNSSSGWAHYPAGSSQCSCGAVMGNTGAGKPITNSAPSGASKIPAKK